MNAGLIKRKKGELVLTTFGKVFYHTILMRIEYAISCSWILKAIDSIEKSNYLQAEELEEIIDKCTFINSSTITNTAYKTHIDITNLASLAFFLCAFCEGTAVLAILPLGSEK
jgi:hypothetical protein